ncbi:MAG: cell division protein ZapE, partial [Rhodospirillaceae bacterium]|nr:cell division protein ZapE [Rhodospirillaceae bacterium]
LAEALPVSGRTLRVPRSVNGAAWFAFDELCGAPLGSADYLALVARYHTLALSGIPVLGPDRRDEARRFALLIDLLYENGTTLICSAAAAPDRLFDLPRDGAIAARAASRLIEMQGTGHLARRSRAEYRGSMSNITCS